MKRVHRFFYFHLVFLLLSCSVLQAQQQSGQRSNDFLDSLKKVYFQAPTNNLASDLLFQIATKENNPDSIEKYSRLLLEVAIVENADKMASEAYLQLGNALNYKGNLSGALGMYLKGIEYAIKSNYKEGEGKAYTALAGTYSQSDNSKNAITYYLKAIPILEESKDTISLGFAVFNIGDEFLSMNILDSARSYNEQALKLFQSIEYKIGEAYCLGNQGILLAKLGQEQQAEKSINEAVEALEAYNDYYGVSAYLDIMSSLYAEQGRLDLALNYARKSLDIAEKHGLKDQISLANLTLARIYEDRGDVASAYKFFKNHIAYRDSVNNIESVQKMANLRTDFEVSQKEAELTIISLRSKRQQLLLYGAITLLVLLAILATVIFRRFKFEKETKEIIEKEKLRSEELLLNILPEEIADELKIHGKVKAHRFNSATVLFTDFKSFSSLAENISPEQLVESIDYYFKEFDSIIDKYDLEKIKTIGDSYMCVSGIPIEKADHAKSAVKAAKEMMAFTLKPKPDHIKSFEMRIGIHTGPIVAGIVGVKKWQYDIWGDTVNIASRMESNSQEGKINISETTYHLVKDEFECEYRGSFEVKNRGVWDMYFLIW